ncbi:hypothetical protein [Methylocystis echinoides]|uniref:hypothetical protein n=1 Tax=Methylocystis echinoides TaxID=29468 RepID=UPI00343E2FE2
MGQVKTTTWWDYNDNPTARLELAKRRQCPCPAKDVELTPVMELLNAAIPREARIEPPHDLHATRLLIEKYVGFIDPDPASFKRPVELPAQFARAFHSLWKSGYFEMQQKEQNG